MKNNNLAKNTIFLTFGTILNKGLVFLMIPLFSKWLSAEDYGFFDLLCTYTAMLIPIISLSSGDGIFRIGIDSKDKNKVISNGLYIFLSGSFLLGILTIFLTIFMKKYIMIPFYFMFLGEFFNKYLQSFLRTIKKLNIYSFSSVISTIFIFIFGFLFIRVFDLGLNGILYGYSFGYLFGNIIIVFAGKLFSYLNFEFSFKTIKEIIIYSLPLIPNSISWWIVNASDRTIINVFLGTLSNGIYAISYKIPNLCSSIFSMFSIAWQEAAIDMKDSELRNSYYEKVYNNMFIIIVLICSGILSLNYFLFKYIFDYKYYEARLYVPILVSSVIFSTISQFLGGIQISLKQQKSNGITTICGAIVNIIVHIMLIKYIGLYAAAISTLVSNIVIVILRKIILSKDVNINLNIKSIIAFIIYLYFVIFSFICFDFNKVISIFNLVLSGFIFLLFNKEIFNKIIKKLIRK